MDDVAMDNVRQWFSEAPKELLDAILESPECSYSRVDTGSIILKFLTNKEFTVQSLKPKSIERNLRTMLQTALYETKTLWSGPVHVTVFILSPRDSDQDEIHIYLNFGGAVKKEKVQLTVEERMLLVEKMDPTQLQQWIFKELQIELETKIMLEKIISWQNLTGQKKMEILLDIVNRLENGLEMLEKFCAESDALLYEQIFQNKKNLPIEEKNGVDQEAELSYQKGEGLQKLYSFWMNIDQDLKQMLDGHTNMDFLPAMTSEMETDISKVQKKTLSLEDKTSTPKEKISHLEEKTLTWDDKTSSLEEKTLTVEGKTPHLEEKTSTPEEETLTHRSLLDTEFFIVQPGQCTWKSTGPADSQLADNNNWPSSESTGHRLQAIGTIDSWTHEERISNIVKETSHPEENIFVIQNTSHAEEHISKLEITKKSQNI